MLSENMINFIEKEGLVDRYKEISEKYRATGQIPMEKIEIDKVKEIIQELGYIAKYYKRENFFKVILKQNDRIQIGYNIGLKYGLVELIIFIFIDGQCIEGAPISFIIQQYTMEEELIKKPRFCSYEELKEILKSMFELLMKYKEEE